MRLSGASARQRFFEQRYFNIIMDIIGESLEAHRSWPAVGFTFFVVRTAVTTSERAVLMTWRRVSANTIKGLLEGTQPTVGPLRSYTPPISIKLPMRLHMSGRSKAGHEPRRR